MVLEAIQVGVSVLNVLLVFCACAHMFVLVAYSVRCQNIGARLIFACVANRRA
jgi:hypothetical protein